ncbi:MAG: sigma-70 family RNA polymerase sigma factor [Planctomycetes bacterium]|jgi:RNA polymerase sigma-70 factor (ECF subfamily)|nr:sigma-70 family RNA polymerase sigma factor [Planctomycetota bacterium]
MRSEDSVPALVRRCQHGERAAFEDLFQRYQPRLRYYVRRLDAGGDHVDDTLQEVWAKVVQRIGSVRDGRAFNAWLYTIARNEVYGRARIRDPFVALTQESLETVADDPEPLFREDEAIRVHRALETLPPEQREILTLCFLEELSHQEIAGILGICVGTVKSRLHYAKRALRARLDTNDESS